MTKLTRPQSFLAVALSLFAVMLAAGAPSPLYVIWSKSMHFSSSTLTVIFAVYVVALLATLLTAGSLSDFVGRRPILITALILDAASVALFIPASSVGGLMLARIVQGVATGLALGALGAMLVDTQTPGTRWGTIVNSVTPPLGLGLGALGAGALSQYAPDPTRLVFWLLLAAVIAAVVATLFLPETGTRRPGALRSLRPEVRVHPEVRPNYFAGLPIFIASWAVAGLYLALGGSLSSGVFGYSSHLLGGVVVAALAATGAITCLVVRDLDAQVSVRIGSVAMVVGLLVGVVGVLIGRGGAGFGVFLAGSVVTGVGFGASFLGAFGAVMARVGVTDRAATLAAVLSVSYLSFAIPAVIAGIVSTHVGLRDTAVGYAISVAVISLVALAVDFLRTESVVTAQPLGEPGLRDAVEAL